MNRRWAGFAAVVAGVAVAFAATTNSGFHSTSVHAAGDCTVADLTFDSEERRFAEIINQYRRENGRPELTVSENLNRAASWMAKDMADKGYFSHEDSLGRGSEERGRDCGTTTKIGENIAAGPSRDTAQEVFDAWKASAGHDRNMLLEGYRQIGIARYYKADSQWGWYWVTDFSLNSDNTNLIDIDIDLPGVDIGIGLGPTKTPTRTPTPTRTATPTRTPTPSSAAVLTSPEPNSTLTGTRVTFRWTAVAGASAYQLYLGTTPGGYDLINYRTSNTAVTISGIPRGSRTLYIRLWTQVGSSWRYNDYRVTTAP